MWQVRGKSNIAEGVRYIPHKAARLLEHLRQKGASVLTATVPWDSQRCDEAVGRGPHRSAQLERAFVFEEMLCQQGYWAVLPYESVRDCPGLRVSPLGAVPKRDRRPHLIVNYSFSAVNAETTQLAPSKAMQFGHCLQRVRSQVLVHADPAYGPVLYLSKIDIADGFYRVWLQLANMIKLGVVLPTLPGRPPLLAFPLTLPMGWVESPPYFTALTQTACDLANAQLYAHRTRARSRAHRLEAVAATPPPDAIANANQGEATRPRFLGRRCPQGRPPVASVDVSVDDFLLMGQTAHQRQAVVRASQSAIDSVFRPLDAADPPYRKEPASVKKRLRARTMPRGRRVNAFSDGTWTLKPVPSTFLHTGSNAYTSSSWRSSVRHGNGCPSRRGTNSWGSFVPGRWHYQAPAGCFRSYKIC